MRMLSIDPGTRGCGAAWWFDGKLAGATYIENPSDKGIGPRECADMAHAVHKWWSSQWYDPYVLALEIPQIYQRAAGKSKGDPNKIMPLFGIGAALAALFPVTVVHFGTPHDWKGGVKKPKSVKEPYPIKAKVIDRLSDEEERTVAWPTNGKKEWDVVDAVGIGLHHLGRFERHRAFARE